MISNVWMVVQAFQICENIYPAGPHIQFQRFLYKLKLRSFQSTSTGKIFLRDNVLSLNINYQDTELIILSNIVIL